MPNRRRRHIPKYRHYRPKNLAVVRIEGKDHYLGRYDSPESWELYERLIAEWLTDGRYRRPTPTAGAATSISINELLLAYWRFAQGYYTKDGKPTKELACMRDALRPLRKLFGRTAAVEFGPKSLRTVRQHMIEEGLCRNVVNRRIGRIKRCFKWAVAEELIPPSLYHGLQAVAGLRHGRTTAKESAPVKPVADAHVNAVLPFLSPHLAAMVQVQRLAAMRPCEVVMLRLCDIDTSGDVWLFEPFDHKTRWRGHKKVIPLGPKVQALLKRFVDRPPDEFLFSPRESEAWRLENRPVHVKANRKTPVYPSELRAREKAKLARRKRKPKRPKWECYDTDSYRRAIKYGIKKARKAGVEVEHWHPNQLRHSRGTEIRKAYGVEGAQVVLGHIRADVTQVYAERNLALAMKIARETG